MSAIDIQYAQMIGDARRWLDRRGYDYIEVGMPLYWTLADCLCVVSYIGLCARPDDDGDAPGINVINIDGDVSQCSSSVRPCELLRVTELTSIQRSRFLWNRNRKLYRHDAPFEFKPDAVREYMKKLLELGWRDESDAAGVISSATGKERRMLTNEYRRRRAERIEIQRLNAMTNEKLRKFF